MFLSFVQTRGWYIDNAEIFFLILVIIVKSVIDIKEKVGVERGEMTKLQILSGRVI